MGTSVVIGNPLGPVSYTHLDVYKRQIQRRTRGDAVEHLAGNVDDRIVRIGNGGHAFPDVYKRQESGCYE